MNQLKAQGLEATPPVYHVFYAFASGGSQPIRDQISAWLAAGRKIREADVLDLYRNHLATQDSSAEGMADYDAMLADTLGMLAAATNQLNAYGRTLVSADKKLKAKPDPASLKTLVSGLVQETKKARDENTKLRSNLETAQKEAETLRRRLDDTSQEARQDGLTKLPNRQAFDEAIVEAAEARNNGDRSAYLILMDIDHFKALNDTHGHQTGDEVLRRVAATLARSVRAGDFIARYGGEEFACLLTGMARSNAESVAETLRVAVKGIDMAGVKEKTIVNRITISLGLAEYREGERIPDWIERADEMLYLAKSKGRDRLESDGRGGAPQKALKSLTALLVEDEIITAMLVGEYLRKIGIGTVIQANDGVEALSLLRRNYVDLVVCDAVMPRMDGLEFVVRMRMDSTRPGFRVPVLMVTAKSDPSWASAARDAGVNEFMTKPFEFDAFAETVREMVFSPRDFVKTDRYTGPDRRRDTGAPYTGPERRKAQ